MAEEPASPTGVPESQDAWNKKTSKNMASSRLLVRDIQTRVRKNEVAEAASKALQQEAAKAKAEEAKNAVKARAAAHEKIIDVSFSCMQDIDDCILTMQDCEVKLKQERMQGFAALQVCQRRLDLRERRPPAETFQDALNDALLNEKKMLETARADMMVLETEAKKSIDDLAAMRCYLSQDTGFRRLEMARDYSSLKIDLAPKSPRKPDPSEEQAEGAEALGAAPASPASPAPASPNAGGEGEAPAPAKIDSKKLIEETQNLLARCRSIRTKSFMLIDRVVSDSRKMLVKTEHAMERRTTDLAKKKKDLEMHQLDVDAAITASERALERMMKRVDPDKDKAKAEKLSQDFNVLESLKKSRRDLQEDIRTKYQALEIDNLCRRVTSAKADSAQRQKAMERTNSAPNLRKKEMGGTATSAFGGPSDFAESMDGSTRAPSSMKPGSPAGGSSSLKAAGAAGLQ